MDAYPSGRQLNQHEVQYYQWCLSDAALITRYIKTLCNQVIAWQTEQKVEHIPSQFSEDDRERNLGRRLAKVLIRRDKAIKGIDPTSQGIKPKETLINEAEVRMINDIPGVPHSVPNGVQTSSQRKLFNQRMKRWSVNRTGTPRRSIKKLRPEVRPVSPNIAHELMASSAMASTFIKTLCEEVLAWQAEQKVGHIPSRRSEDDRERKLGKRLAKALIRREKPLGKHPSEILLNQDEFDMINDIPGVPDIGRE